MIKRMKSAPNDLVPAELVSAIENAAEEEHRTPRELDAEAVERYLSERQFFRADDAHRKISKGLESLRRRAGLDGEAVIAELFAELDTPPSKR
jgi:hypothetical protein